MVMIFDFNNACTVVDDDYHDNGTNEMIKATEWLERFCQIYVACLSKPLPHKPHYSLFCGQL